jgi:hypothetical protein
MTKLKFTADKGFDISELVDEIISNVDHMIRTEFKTQHGFLKHNLKVIMEFKKIK